ncbi:protein misato homolog 1-like [Mizuhopecten yessoensis]|uniref:Protein misato-like 1 n=1 Tax=Mizuhopecten yessoensis TaxID=6573 RepID=A0A210Q3B0_MIZYE|nr:protein misato homolog 1-like [Mizuhopecten yessoensis]OWF43159.1 Protein misato-like 1 [Mizuhopecten yessoensis]
MSSREVVTLQIGHYSNYVGSHWWNIQESSFIYDPKLAPVQKDIDHDVLFREGKNLRGEVTYTPRLVAFDLKGSLNTLKQEGSLYDHRHQEEIRWTGDVTLHQEDGADKNPYLLDLEKEEQLYMKDNTGSNNSQESIDDVEIKDSGSEVKERKQKSSDAGIRNKFYKLDDSVTVWSDYLRTFLHPKSIHVIEKYRHKNDLQPFDIYGCGQEVMADYETRIEVEDRLHFFIEECDHLQGFHVLLDTFDGFGGLGSHVLQHLEDEYSSKGIFTFGLTPNNLPDDTPQKRANRILNSAISYSKCWSNSSLFVPMCLANSLWKTIGPPVQLSHLQYKSLDYHTSAILAATLDSVTSPYRQPAVLHMRDLTDTFQSIGRKMASVSTSFPYPIHEDQFLVDSLMSIGNDLPWVSLTPHVKNTVNPFLQSTVVRGISNNIAKRSVQDERSPHQFRTCQTVDDVLQMYLRDRFPTTHSDGTVLRDPCKVVSPYPHIFDPNVSKNGFLSSTKRADFQGVESVPVMTSLQSTSDTVELLQTLHTEASKLNIHKHHRYLAAGIEEDDYVEILANFETLQHCYEEPGDMG